MGAIDWTAFKIRRATNSNILGYWMYTKTLMRSGNKHFVRIRDARNGNYAFLLDGYPRSGNTFLTSMVSKTLNFRNFVHHTHSALAIRYAIDNGKSAYLLFRDPRDCCSSRILLGSNAHPQRFRLPMAGRLYSSKVSLMLLYLREYIHYYEFAFRNRRSVTLIPSNIAFVHYHEVLKMIAEQNGIPEHELARDHCEADRQRYFESKRKKTRKSVLSSSLPNESKQQAKRNILKTVQNHPLMCRARRLHEELNNHSWKPGTRG